MTAIKKGRSLSLGGRHIRLTHAVAGRVWKKDDEWKDVRAAV